VDVCLYISGHIPRLKDQFYGIVLGPTTFSKKKHIQFLRGVKIIWQFIIGLIAVLTPNFHKVAILAP